MHTPFVDFSSPNFRNLVRTTPEEDTPGRVLSFQKKWKVTKSGRSGRAVFRTDHNVVVGMGCVGVWMCGRVGVLSSWIPDPIIPCNMQHALSMHCMHCALHKQK